MKATAYMAIFIAGLVGASGVARAVPVVDLTGYTRLAGWYDFNSSAAPEDADYLWPGSTLVNGYSGTVTKTTNSTGYGTPDFGYGSTDGYYGNTNWTATSYSNYPTEVNGALVMNSTAWTQFAVTNINQPTTLIGYLIFDAKRTATTSPETKINVSYQKGAGPITPLFTNLNDVTGLTTYGDYNDFSFNLSGMGLTIAAGETINFLFALSNGGSPTARLDQVGITMGIPVPEPGSLVALGCFLGSGLLIRRNRRTIA